MTASLGNRPAIFSRMKLLPDDGLLTRGAAGASSRSLRRSVLAAASFTPRGISADVFGSRAVPARDLAAAEPVQKPAAEQLVPAGPAGRPQPGEPDLSLGRQFGPSPRRAAACPTVRTAFGWITRAAAEGDGAPSIVPSPRIRVRERCPDIGLPDRAVSPHIFSDRRWRGGQPAGRLCTVCPGAGAAQTKRQGARPEFDSGPTQV
jgi:hypothetical protein